MPITRISDRFEEAVLDSLGRQPEAEGQEILFDFTFVGQGGVLTVAVPSPILGMRLAVIFNIDIDTILDTRMEKTDDLAQKVFSALAEQRSQVLAEQGAKQGLTVPNGRV